MRQSIAIGWISSAALVGCAPGSAISPVVEAAALVEKTAPVEAAPPVEKTTPVEAAPAPGPRCVVPMTTAMPVEPARAEDCPAAPGSLPSLKSAWLRFPDAPKAPPLQVERADEQSQRMLGLMYRTNLGPERGMLFSWDEERPRSFWMKNTCIPLDMLFIDREGYIVGILEHVPTLNEAPRRIDCPASRVLEVNAGFARRHGIAPGQRIEVEP